MIRINRPACPHPEALKQKTYKHPINKSALREASNGKCMYCESDVSHIDYAQIEHIQPKAIGQYPELEFEWENLGYSCAKCNNTKSNKYHSETPYINPYDENPNDNLVFSGPMLFSKKGSERGELSIEDIGLNRPELIEKEQQKLTELMMH